MILLDARPRPQIGYCGNPDHPPRQHVVTASCGHVLTFEQLGRWPVDPRHV